MSWTGNKSVPLLKQTTKILLFACRISDLNDFDSPPLQRSDMKDFFHFAVGTFPNHYAKEIIPEDFGRLLRENLLDELKNKKYVNEY